VFFINPKTKEKKFKTPKPKKNFFFVRPKLEPHPALQFSTREMATLRISSKQIKAISLQDERTWPVDLQDNLVIQVWVELTGRHRWKSWHPPFYLSHEQVKIFREKALGLRTTRPHSQ
jgi:hypothetical protein